MFERVAAYASHVRRCALAGTLVGAGIGLLMCRSVAADPLRWHLDAGGAHAIGDPQGREYGFGATGHLALELPLNNEAGVQAKIGGLWLADGSPPSDPTLANHGAGTALSAMAGIRLRPFTRWAGPWVDVDLGYLRTGDKDRFGFDADAGYDFRIGQGRWDVGPYVGYVQIVEPDDSLRPQDAHILSLGIHVGL